MRSAPIYRSIFCLLLLAIAIGSHAQSTTIIYNENFNSGPGGWTIGGYNASWNYGVPTLPNIVSNGTACFATGDAGVAQTEPFTSCLTVPGPSTNGNFYNCCERSYIESPVINLTGINSPLLSLDLNLYCEQTFDGSKVQLSIDGGISWQDIGSYNSGTFQVFPSAINCREQNWYNKNNVNYLSGTSGGCGTVNFNFGGDKNGWSGGCSQSSNGSCTSLDIHGTNGWVTATHCITAAANKPNVKIRIAFGAGSQVFSDGIAIDNVKISNVFPVVNFSGSQLPTCQSEFAFTNNSDCAETWSWNFGHPGSPNNTSSASDPTHVFPSAGNYTITLTATDFCGGSSFLSKPVIVTDGIAPKIDSIFASSSGLCNSATDTIAIYLVNSFQGVPPYEVSYNFNGINHTVSGLTGNPIVLTNLQPGNYSSLNINDNNGCETNLIGDITIPLNNDSLQITISNDTTILAGGTAPLFVSTNISSTYSWSPFQGLDNPSSAMPVASPEVTTTYSVIATDINGCTSVASVVVFVDDISGCDNYFVPNSFTPNGDGNNDTFIIKIDPSMRLEKFGLKIYNRWGEQVFETDAPLTEWKGANNPQGIYIVLADFNCRNKIKSRYTGTLNLIR